MMNLFSFDIIYKKGEEMPADFLSRNAVDAINFDLTSFAQEQNKDEILRNLRLYLLNKVLPENNKIAQLVYKMSHDCFVLNGVVWKRLGLNQQNRSVLLVPQHLIKEILSESHGHLLAGHFGINKTKQRILQSYYWPNMDKDITEHLQSCDKCQLTKVGKVQPELLSPLPQCTEPNQRVHADLFGPLKCPNGDKKFILCVTDAFTKYVELVVIPNKEALTVATAILNRWICRFGLPLELITDQGKEFTNQMAEHLFKSLDIRHSTTTSYHPQCNSQAEVCNKTIAKYLAAFVDGSTLDWEIYVPALMFAYNTSFHRSIQATPFSLTYGLEARLPSFFAPDFRRLHDPHLADDNLLRTLHQARDIAVSANMLASDKQKSYFDKTATHHEFHEGQFVLLNEFNFLNKNRKLAPKYSGPFKIIRVKGPHNVELLLTNGRKIVVNVARVKRYFGATSFSDDSESLIVPNSNVPTDNNLLNGKNLLTDPPQSFNPRALTAAHTRAPGRPRKVLSPASPDVPFSKKGREKDDDTFSQNETGFSPAPAPAMEYKNTHHMMTRAGIKMRNSDANVTTLTQNKNKTKVFPSDTRTKLSDILIRTYRCVIDKKPKRQTKQMSERKVGLGLKQGRPSATRPGLDPYKYSIWPESGISGPSQNDPAPGAFADIIGDHYFDSSDSDNSISDSSDSTLLEEEDSEVEHVADLDDDRADISSPFHGFPSPPARASTPINLGELLDDTVTPGEDGAIGGRTETPPPLDTTAASLAEQSEFYSALLDEVEFFTEGAEQALQAVQALDPASQLQVEEEIRKRGLQLQDQLNWAEVTLQDEAIESVRATRARRTPRRPSPTSPPTPPGPPSSPLSDDDVRDPDWRPGRRERR
jgi:hypothetical protein